MVSATKLVCLNLVFALYCGWAVAEKVMRPNFKEVKLWSDEKHVSHKLAFDPTDPHLNLTIHVLKDLQDVDVHTDIRIVQKQDTTYHFMTNTTINLCRLFNWRNLSPIGSLIHNYLNGYGKMIDKCPIVKGEYYIHKFWYPEDATVSTLPEFDFEINFAAYHVNDKSRELIINDHIIGEGVVQDVNNLRPGVLAFLPKAG